MAALIAESVPGTPAGPVACVHGAVDRDLAAVCGVMIDDVGLANFTSSPTNRFVMRSFVEDLGIGRPVWRQARSCGHLSSTITG